MIAIIGVSSGVRRDGDICRLHAAGLDILTGTFMRHTIVILSLLTALAAGGVAHAAAYLAGDLPRRAALGFASEPDGGAIKVVQVAEGSAAATAGLLVGDQIAAINGGPVGDVLDGADRLRRTLANTELRLSVLRQGRRLDLKFTAPPRPLEDMPGMDSIYDAAQVGGAKLRTITAIPAGARGPLPVLLLTQWVSCGSIEHNARSPWRRAVAEFVRAQKVAYVRVERASDGDSEGPACHKLDYDTEVRHYVEAFDAVLSSNKRLDPSRVFIMGSSLGSTTAPLVALALQERGRRVLGVAVQGGGAVTYFERMLNFERFYLERRPDAVKPHEIHDQMMKRIHFLHEYLIKGRSPDEIARDSAEMAAIRADIRGLGAGEHYGRPYTWHQQAARRNFLAAWAALKARVLVVFGEYDQFESVHGHALIAQIVNRLRPGGARFLEIKGADHDLVMHRTIEEAYADAESTQRRDKDLFDALGQMMRQALR
jgi:pimeloyl-ACP methyl ester carboxylesterase